MRKSLEGSIERDKDLGGVYLRIVGGGLGGLLGAGFFGFLAFRKKKLPQSQPSSTGPTRA